VPGRYAGHRPRRMATMELIQVAQHADDLDRAVEFYTRLTGVGPVARFDPPGLAFFALGSVRLLLEGGATSAALYLRVADVRERIPELRAEGVEIIQEPHIIFSHSDDRLGPAGTDEWMAFIRDSEGNVVGLVSHHSSSSSSTDPR
jgi:methylmalonyl-CoA/ethylmalonyl-CoA epimerase